MTKLLPCPFCGDVNADVWVNDSCHYASIGCNNPQCGAVGPISVTRVGPGWREIVEEDASLKWNERARLEPKQ